MRSTRALPAFEVVQVTLMVAADLVHAVAAELVEKGGGQHDRHHRLADDAGRGHRAHVAALHDRLDGLLGLHVYGAQRLAQRREGLHGRAHDHGLAVGDAALEPAGAVGSALEAAVLVQQDLVVNLGAGPTRRLEAQADLGPLDGVDGAERLGQQAVQLAVPLDVGAEPHRAAQRHHFEDPAERVARRLGPVDGVDHRALGLRVGAAYFRFLGASPDLVPRQLERADADAADLDHMAEDRDPELAQELLGHAGHRDPGRGLAGARALEHVPDVVVGVLHGPRQVGVARARPGHGLGRRPLWRRAYRHGLLPVLPVAVLDRQRDRTAEGHAPADAGGDVGLVPLDLHPAAAAVAALAAGQVLVDVGFGERQAGGNAVDDGGQRLAVGLAGG